MFTEAQKSLRSISAEDSGSQLDAVLMRESNVPLISLAICGRTIDGTHGMLSAHQ